MNLLFIIMIDWFDMTITSTYVTKECEVITTTKQPLLSLLAKQYWWWYSSIVVINHHRRFIIVIIMIFSRHPLGAPGFGICHWCSWWFWASWSLRPRSSAPLGLLISWPEIYQVIDGAIQHSPSCLRLEDISKVCVQLDISSLDIH